MSLSGSLIVGHYLVDKLHTGFESAEERLLLFLDHLLDKVGRSDEFGISLTHRLDESVDELVHKCALEVEESVAITHCTAQDSANHIACLGVRRELVVGDRESDGAHVVGDYAHSHIGVCIGTILHSGDFAHLADKRLEHVGVVVRLLALESHAKALKAHTGVDNLCRESFERAVGFVVVLHEHEVPDFDNLRVACIHQLAAGLCSTFSLVAEVDVNLRAGTARTCVAHFPEVVVAVTVDDMVSREVFLPVACCLIVALQTFGSVTLEHCGIEVLGIELEHIDEIFPRPVDSLFLEVVAKRPVSEHLKHGVVVGVETHLFQVVMLTAHAQALLRIGRSLKLRRNVSKNDVLELIHTCIGEHKCRVVLDDHRCRGHDSVSLAAEEIFERFSNFFSCKHTLD